MKREDQFVNKLQKILEDRGSGSSLLLSSLIETLRADPDQIKLYLERTAPLEQAFALVFHFNEFLRNECKTTSITAKALDQYVLYWKEKEATMIKDSSEKLQNCSGLLLHSHSGTLCRLMKKVAESKTLHVLQTESRPIMEGRFQAEKLAGMGHRVTMITDSALSHHVHDFDACLLGADLIFPEMFINKTGSLGIALLCDFFNKPLYVVGDERKKVPNTFRFHEEPKPGRELWENIPGDIRTRNLYFEPVPNRLVTEFFICNS